MFDVDKATIKLQNQDDRDNIDQHYLPSLRSSRTITLGAQMQNPTEAAWVL
jgi:hypothetical protein